MKGLGILAIIAAVILPLISLPKAKNPAWPTWADKALVAIGILCAFGGGLILANH